MPGGLLTDLYELNMAVSYLRRGMTGPATFSLIAAGLEDCLAFLADFSFTADHLGSAPRWGFPPMRLYLEGGAYKLTEFGGRLVMKLSHSKATLPGVKQVHRRPDGDLLARRDEPAPPGLQQLLAPVMRHGGRR